jgi:hypothetical protein
MGKQSVRRQTCSVLVLVALVVAAVLLVVALVVATIFLDLLPVNQCPILLSNPYSAVIWLSVNAD